MLDLYNRNFQENLDVDFTTSSEFPFLNESHSK